MKIAKLTATLDYFCNCPHCGFELETNIEGKVKCVGCGKKYVVEFDPHYFSVIASYSIYKNESHENR